MIRLQNYNIEWVKHPESRLVRLSQLPWSSPIVCSDNTTLAESIAGVELYELTSFR